MKEFFINNYNVKTSATIYIVIIIINETFNPSRKQTFSTSFMSEPKLCHLYSEALKVVIYLFYCLFEA